MHKLFLTHIRYTLPAILILLISGCASVQKPNAAVTDTFLPQTNLTLPASRSPNDSLVPTLATSVSTQSTPSVNPICSQAEIEQYEKAVLPLADEHTLDANEAKKMERITDEAQLLSFMNRAAGRRESLQAIQAPACLLEAHEKLALSFDLLATTWDLIKAKDFPTATTRLQASYEALGEGIAKIAILKLGW